MLEILIQNTESIKEPDGDGEIRKWVTEERMEKSHHMRTEEAAKTSLAAEYLLNRGIMMLREQNRLPEQWKKISIPVSYERNEYGAPCLPGSGLWFNWSHSGPYAVCVIADHPVGIDLEKRREYRKRLVERYYPGEVKKIMEESEKEEAEKIFTRYWTLWESVLKAEGTGFYKAGRPEFVEKTKENGLFLQKGKIKINGEKYMYYQYLERIPGYEICVAYEKSDEMNVLYEKV